VKVWVVQEVNVHGNGRIDAVFSNEASAREYKCPYPNPLVGHAVSCYEVQEKVEI